MWGLFGVLNKTVVPGVNAPGIFIYFSNKMQQLSIFDIPQLEKPQIELCDLFDAYYSCRSNKRNTINALAFETDFESNLITLWNEINSGT